MTTPLTSTPTRVVRTPPPLTPLNLRQRSAGEKKIIDDLEGTISFILEITGDMRMMGRMEHWLFVKAKYEGAPKYATLEQEIRAIERGAQLCAGEVGRLEEEEFPRVRSSLKRYQMVSVGDAAGRLARAKRVLDWCSAVMHRARKARQTHRVKVAKRVKMCS